MPGRSQGFQTCSAGFFSAFALLVVLTLSGCATSVPPVDPAFERLSAQIRDLIKLSYPDAKVTIRPSYLAASVRMAPPTRWTRPEPPDGYVYVDTYFPEKTGFTLEMYVTTPRVMNVPTPAEGWEQYRSGGYYGDAYLAGTRQIVCIYYQTGSSAPKRFNRAMKSLIRRGTEPYHRPKG